MRVLNEVCAHACGGQEFEKNSVRKIALGGRPLSVEMYTLHPSIANIFKADDYLINLVVKDARSMHFGGNSTVHLMYICGVNENCNLKCVWFVSNRTAICLFFSKLSDRMNNIPKPTVHNTY